ncbi:nucleoside 2-deoxyribosyltransferase [Candidatus Daviesbacteria bacterium]|nr:nucleoside 2-deoxyribosyltransferase [Candidatus Daviesbacteria bacterium]
MARKLKVYFACSIKGEQGGKEEKIMITNIIKDLGHKILTEIILGHDLNANDTANLTPPQIYERDINWINDSDLVVADVTRISMGVGYEIGWVLRGGGKVVALCRADRKDALSNMIKGIIDKNFSLHYWENEDDLKIALKNELEKLV